MVSYSNAVPGIAIRLIDQEKTLKAIDKGIRSIGQSTPITTNDKWHIGSCTKTMTSYLIAQLIDQKKLRLDSKLTEIFPTTKMDKNFKLITVQDLLAHRSGIKDVSEIEPYWSTSFTKTDYDTTKKQREDFLNVIALMPTHFAPGEKNEYSNAGYVLLGTILEKMYNDSWENIITERLFKPLKMHNCGFGPSATRNLNPPDHTIGHTIINKQLTAVFPGDKEITPSDNPIFLGPAGTVNCSMSSWGKFLSEMLNASLGKSTFLSKSTAQLVFSDYKDLHTVGGWGTIKKEWAAGTVYTMVGSNTMNYAMFIIIPGKKLVAYGAVNSGTDEALKTLTSEIKNLIPK